MPYIDTYAWFDVKLLPQEGETYLTFKDRCMAGILALKPNIDANEANEVIERSWANHILQTASMATVTIKRDLIVDTVYADAWWTDWRISEIHSAEMPSVVYSSIEKSKKPEEDFRIAKSIDEKQIIFGWANIAKDADGNYPIDWDGDVTSPEELENAAYTYVLKYRTMGEKHDGEAVAHLIESAMFTKEKQAAMGIPEGLLPEGWWTGFFIPDKEVFAKVKSGEYEMLSVQGKAQRVPTQQ